MYKCFRLVYLLILFASNVLYGQSTTNDSIPKQRTVFRINLAGVGVGAELPIFPKLSTYLEAGMGYNLQFVEEQGKTRLRSDIFPFFRAQARYYYSRNKRIAKGKDVDKFTGEFLSITTSYLSDTKNKENVIGIGGGFGFQSHFKKRGFVGFLIGPGVAWQSRGEIWQLRVYLNTWLGLGFAF